MVKPYDRATRTSATSCSWETTNVQFLTSASRHRLRCHRDGLQARPYLVTGGTTCGSMSPNH